MASNMHKYETYPLHHVYHMIENNVGDRKSLLTIAEKAYLVALAFDDFVTKDWIVSYLNNDLPVDALSKLSLTANILHKDEEGPHVFSVSHGLWLSKLRSSKLSVNKHDVTSSSSVVDDLFKSFQSLQDLSMSHQLFSY